MRGRGEGDGEKEEARGEGGERIEVPVIKTALDLGRT